MMVLLKAFWQPILLLCVVAGLYFYIGSIKQVRDQYRQDLEASQQANKILTQQLATANDLTARLDRLAEQDRQLDRSLQYAADQIRAAPGSNDLVPPELAHAWYDSIISVREHPVTSSPSVSDNSAGA